jgi:hypothetical protein
MSLPTTNNPDVVMTGGAAGAATWPVIVRVSVGIGVAPPPLTLEAARVIVSSKVPDAPGQARCEGDRRRGVRAPGGDVRKRAKTCVRESGISRDVEAARECTGGRSRAVEHFEIGRERT